MKVQVSTAIKAAITFLAPLQKSKKKTDFN